MDILHRLMLGVLCLSPTIALASVQSFGFVINGAQSSSTLYYSNQYGTGCGGTPACNYRFNYAVSGTFTMTIDLDPAKYNAADHTYYRVIDIPKRDIAADWISATPLALNPA